MHFTANKEHRDYFRKENRIECEELFSIEEADKLYTSICNALIRRLDLKGKSVDIDTVSPDRLFAIGRDLWRDDTVLKKVAHSRALAGVAAELTEHRPLRIGYDMFLPTSHSETPNVLALKQIADKTLTLNEISTIQGVICGAIICVKAPNITTEGTNQLFPTIPGNTIFFPPDWPLPLSEINKRQGGAYWMIVYANARAVYVRKEEDPHMTAFQRYGYQFGDRLNDVLNPLVYT